jgi:hypothetical protein
VIRVRGDVDLTTENQMIAAARRRAARFGANALLIEHIRNPSTETQIAAVLFGTPDPRRGRMVGFLCPPHGTDEAGTVTYYSEQGRSFAKECSAVDCIAWKPETLVG